MWMESCLLPADLGRGLHHVKTQEKEVKQELWCFLSQITRKRVHFIMKIRHFVLASPLIIEWQLYSAARRNSHFERSYECLVPIWWQWRKGIRISQSKHMEGCFQLLITWQTSTEGLLCARHSEDIQEWERPGAHGSMQAVRLKYLRDYPPFSTEGRLMQKLGDLM